METDPGSCCGSLGGSAEDLRELVRERYAALAASAASCCAGPAEQAEAYAAELYSPAEVAALPSEVRRLAMGCGNPTALAALRPGMTVVDLGSGAGVDAILAAHKVGGEGRVIGVDMTEQMVARAKEAACSLGLANVEFRLGRIEELPVEDGVADAVISNCVINLSPEKDKVFSEAFRVLRLGGLLAVTDMVLNRPLPEAIRANPAAWSSCVSGALMLDDYLDLMRAAGFKQTLVKELVTYSGEQVAAFKEIDEQLFGQVGKTLTQLQAVALDGCLASARVVALKFESCC